ncbi:unnamed protein product [Vitrella brassicaformis CCMP3155]|uniref:Uncharacterized protein n=1 Tax=Vitrella brassicaformis (strain CCMP3155) TaxID=1169540 RepID=A0A0G4GJT2_VITBC|nr:unnamed protein product [Vitrella brassicaformis CCMP3155]|eukprot:CEM30156.1 unnamed protein product [Vitrella brassicaformis CCMP3155]
MIKRLASVKKKPSEILQAPGEGSGPVRRLMRNQMRDHATRRAVDSVGRALMGPGLSANGRLLGEKRTGSRLRAFITGSEEDLRQLQADGSTSTESPPKGDCPSPCMAHPIDDHCVPNATAFQDDIDALTDDAVKGVLERIAKCRDATSRSAHGNWCGPDTSDDCEWNEENAVCDPKGNILVPFFGLPSCCPTIDCPIHGKQHGACMANWTAAYEEKLVGVNEMCRQFAPIWSCERLTRDECDKDSNCAYESWLGCKVKSALEDELNDILKGARDLSICGPLVRCHSIGFSKQYQCEADLACVWTKLDNDPGDMGFCHAHPAVTVANPDLVSLETEKCKAKLGFHVVPWRCGREHIFANDNGKTCFENGACTLVCPEWGETRCDSNYYFLLDTVIGQELPAASDLVDRMDECFAVGDKMYVYNGEVTAEGWSEHGSAIRDKCPNIIDPTTLTVNKAVDPVSETIALAQTAAAFQPPSKCSPSDGCRVTQTGACVPDSAKLSSRIDALADEEKAFLQKELDCIELGESACTGDCEWDKNDQLCQLSVKVAIKLVFGVDSCGKAFDCGLSITQEECNGDEACYWDERKAECLVKWSFIRDISIGTEDECTKYKPLIECGGLTPDECKTADCKKHSRKEKAEDLFKCGPNIRCPSMDYERSLCNRDQGCFHSGGACGKCNPNPMHLKARDDGETCLHNSACQLWCHTEGKELECHGNEEKLQDEILPFSKDARDLQAEMERCLDVYDDTADEEVKQGILLNDNYAEAKDVCGIVADPGTITPDSDYEQALSRAMMAASEAGEYQPSPASLQCEAQIAAEAGAVTAGRDLAALHLGIAVLFLSVFVVA